MKPLLSLLCRIAGIILVFFILASAGVSASPLLQTGGSAAGGLQQGAGPYTTPELLRALLEAEPDETLRVIVYVREQANLEAAASGALDAGEARVRIVSALQTSAARSQASLRAYLEQAQGTGLVESYTPFWIFNGIAVRARPAAIRALAADPTVAIVDLDHWRQWIAESPVANSKLQIANQQISNFQSPISNRHSPIAIRHSPFAIRHSPFSPEWGIARIRADQVWASLHISGTGAVVAGMDTGADWLHPALQANYRGYNPHGPANHTYSWYDATDGGALYPVDGHGHGTHTLGTIVGQDGIGVAPGARWIAVKVLNNQGYGYDSWIHEGFQWLLAPGGDPARAPDVVNCSWGSDNGFLTVFQPDLQALRAAGILAVFSAGNNGPAERTVCSPASLPEAFAVGATEFYDEVALFSSRGPSPWGQVRPHVAAPGVNIRSSLPGAAYGLMDGTSMAAPHVSGIVALLRSVSPTLSITRTALLITSTAVPVGTPIPNNDAGWGRVDAFAAVVALSGPGLISGTVARAGDGAPVAGATVVATLHGGGSGGQAVTAEDGSYVLALAPTTYDLTASAFGYESATAWGTTVLTGVATVVDFSLVPLPVGALRCRITDAANDQPLTATLSVLNTPLEASANTYTFTLPGGTYTLRARSLGHRVVTATAVITVGEVTAVDLALPPAPSILLVDSGPWYYHSQAHYFRQALDDLAYAYDERAIKHLPDDVPTASNLASYDIVVWSAPSDAPGYIGAQNVITRYLSSGGHLLLSGQDVGYLDGAGWSDTTYYRDYLKVSLVQDNAESWTLQGTPGDIFAGLAITIAGPGGADNQDFPDEIAVVDPDAAAPVLAYQADGCGGVRVGTCLDYQVLYLSFGFEAINERAARREVMKRTLDWLTTPPPTAGLELKPVSQMHIGPPGSAVTHTLRLRHLGQGGITDTVSLSLVGASWMTQPSVPALSLAPCTSATVIVTTIIPATAGWNAQDIVALTAHSSLSPTVAVTAVLTTKTPAPILLVDDDRWYDEEDRYEAALASSGLFYDYWRTGQAHGEPAVGGPPSDVLQRYPIVVWFTGYDWYAPVTAEEEATLAAYLDGGGRLFLSSQDYLYYHHNDPFSRNYLGVITCTEDITPTLAQGVPENMIGDRLGPYPLDYPFRNWSDMVVPTPGTAVLFRDQGRRPIALARQATNYRTVFFSFPYETLPEAGRTAVLERIVGWLSWLGGSTFTADRSAISAGDGLTYTIVLRNDGPEIVSASLSNTLPLSLTMISHSLTGPATYEAPARLVSWNGSLGPGAAITFTYRVAVATGLPAGTSIANTARLGLEDQGIRFHRSAVVRVDAPDLSPSALQCSPALARPGSVVTCMLRIANVGPANALTVTAVTSFTPNAVFVPGSPIWQGEDRTEASAGTLYWAGPLGASEQVTLTYPLTLPTDLIDAPLSLYGVTFLDDNIGGAWERVAWVDLAPWQVYFPLAGKNGPQK